MKDILLKSILPALCTCLTNEKVQEELKKLGVVLPGLSIAAAMTNALVGAVAPSILSNFATSISYNKLKSILQDEHPNRLNHDLSKLLQDAAVRSVTFIERLYLDKLENDNRLKEDREHILAAKSNLSKIKDWFSENLLKSEYFYDEAMLQNSESCLTKITDSLFGIPVISENEIWNNLRKFFQQNLPSCFDLAFKEALKENERGRISFQIWIWEDIKRITMINREQLERIKVEIIDLKEGISKNDKLFKDEISGMLSTILSNQKELIVKVDEILEGIKIILTNQQSTAHKLPELIQNIDKELFKYAQSVYYNADTKNTDGASAITKDNLSEKIAEYHKVCVVGEPGMGKSFLARKVVYNIYLTEEQKIDSRKYDIIWWIDADTNKVENELIALAGEVCGQEKVAEWLAKAGTGDAINNAGVLKELFDELKKRSWLIVFDNAMDTDTASGFGQDLITLGDYAKKYLPETTTKGHLLLTSRNKSWTIRGGVQYPFQPLYLEKWTDESVKDYLEKPERPKRKITISSLKQISIFQGLPLAVTIAKSYILSINKSDRFSIFYEKWEDQFREIEKETYDIDRKLLTTITVSYQHLPTVLQQFINVLACFAPDDLPVLSLYESNGSGLTALIGKEKLIDKQTDCCVVNHH